MQEKRHCQERRLHNFMNNNLLELIINLTVILIVLSKSLFVTEHLRSLAIMLLDLPLVQSGLLGRQRNLRKLGGKNLRRRTIEYS